MRSKLSNERLVTDKESLLDLVIKGFEPSISVAGGSVLLWLTDSLENWSFETRHRDISELWPVC